MPPPLAAGREVRSAALKLLVCLATRQRRAVVKAVGAQAMSEGVPDQPA